MAGFVAQTPTDLITDSVTVSPGAEVQICDIVINNAAFADVRVDFFLDTAATDGVEVTIKRKLAASTDVFLPDNAYQVLSISPSSTTNLHYAIFVLQAGIYRLIVKNNDATYNAIVSAVKQTNFTWG